MEFGGSESNQRLAAPNNEHENNVSLTWSDETTFGMYVSLISIMFLMWI